MTTVKLSQMDAHGVNRSKYPFASFCFGRGWKGHATEDAARKAADRDARRCVRQFGGGYPQHLVARTDTGVVI